VEEESCYGIWRNDPTKEKSKDIRNSSITAEKSKEIVTGGKDALNEETFQTNIFP